MPGSLAAAFRVMQIYRDEYLLNFSRLGEREPAEALM